MNYMKNKRGQFFLISAIILVSLIIGLVAISNSSFKQENISTEELAEELSIESEKVMDYDILNSQSQFENFARDYSAYAGNSRRIYFITYNQGASDAFRYDNGQRISHTNDLNISNEIVFTLDEDEYRFDLEEGRNFYFIITEEKDGEKYVYTG